MLAACQREALWSVDMIKWQNTWNPEYDGSKLEPLCDESEMYRKEVSYVNIQVFQD